MYDKTILIQGALDIEIQFLIDNLKCTDKIIIAGYEFHIGYLNNLKVVISKTQVGTINSSTATTIGVIKFNPIFVINQGIAGAYREDINIGDIVVGEKCRNINAFSMPTKSAGDGSNPFDWQLNKRAEEIFYGNTELINSFYDFSNLNYNNSIYIGTIGSGDVFNRETDRINWLYDIFGNVCEDMETIGTYSVCNKFDIPCIGIRIISNNELIGKKLDKTQSIELQKLILLFLQNI